MLRAAAERLPWLLCAVCRCADYQEVRIQEKVQSLSVGMIPRQIAVLFMDDLVDVCKAGDDVIVTGIVMNRWKPCKQQSRCDVELCILANSARVRCARRERRDARG